jgi:hypothetical protein
MSEGISDDRSDQLTLDHKVDRPGYIHSSEILPKVGGQPHGAQNSLSQPI